MALSLFGVNAVGESLLLARQRSSQIPVAQCLRHRADEFFISVARVNYI